MTRNIPSASATVLPMTRQVAPPDLYDDDERPWACSECGESGLGTPEQIAAVMREHWRRHHGYQPHALSFKDHRPSPYRPPVVDEARCNCGWIYFGPTTYSRSLAEYLAHTDKVRSQQRNPSGRRP